MYLLTLLLHFRNKIGDIRAQAAPSRPLDSSGFLSSDDSLIELELLQGAPPTPPPRPPGCVPPSTPHTPHSADRAPPPTSFAPVSAERISATTNTTLERSFDSGVSGGPANSSFLALSVDGSRLSRRDLGSRRRSQRSSATLERRGKSADPIERSTYHDSDEISAANGGLWPSSELSRSLDWTGGASPRRRSGNESVQLARAELRQRLRQLALVSESGSAAVLDVIEPSGSEAGSAEDLVQREVEAQRRARARSAPPPRPSSGAGEVDNHAELLEDEDPRWLDAASYGDEVDVVDNGDGQGDGSSRHPRPKRTESPQRRASTRRASPGKFRDTNGSERTGRSGRGDRARRSGRARREGKTGREVSTGREASAGRAGPRVAEQTPPADRTPPGSVPILSAPDILQGTRHWRDPGEDSDEPSPEKPDLPLFQLGNTTPSTAAVAAAAAAAAVNDAANAGKKRSFLQKFSIRTRWTTPKRRERPARPGQEITAVDFRETYPTESRDDTLSMHESTGNDEVDDPPPPLLPRAEVTTADTGRISRGSRTSQGEIKPEAEHGDTASESNFLDGSHTDDLFTAVCVNTYADSASESSRSAVSRRSRQSSSPGRPLLSGGQPAYGPTGRQGVAVTGTSGSEADPGVTSRVPGVSRPASSASVVSPGRHSPAASEASRTESALAPPSDVSVTESARHLSAAAAVIGGATVRTTGGATGTTAAGGAGQKTDAVQKTSPGCTGATVAPAGQTKLVSFTLAAYNSGGGFHF